MNTAQPGMTAEHARRFSDSCFRAFAAVASEPAERYFVTPIEFLAGEHLYF